MSDRERKIVWNMRKNFSFDVIFLLVSFFPPQPTIWINEYIFFFEGGEGHSLRTAEICMGEGVMMAVLWEPIGIRKIHQNAATIRREGGSGGGGFFDKMNLSLTNLVTLINFVIRQLRGFLHNDVQKKSLVQKRRKFET